ncbi:MAG: hypothetical protein GQ570_09800 [Helicobacteraceae bacterium]|nr:hypothetical protein [Helicobacteraceae bacterium]
MKTKNIVILTGSEQRHAFIRKSLALNNNINVMKSYCEIKDGSLDKVVSTYNDDLQKEHLVARKQSEEDFFNSLNIIAPDMSNPYFITKGTINEDSNIQEIISLNPDLIIAYGCSLIKPKLINFFKQRFFNIHLGLSPYYRGSGTNFFPLVNAELEYVGATFMYIDEGIDTGDIIHQIRARVFKNDTPHQIGNRLISDIAIECIKIVNNSDVLKSIIQPKDKKNGKYYKQSDFTPAAVAKVYSNFNKGIVNTYLKMKESEKALLFENPTIKEI